MYLELSLLIYCFILIAINSLSRSALTELTPQFLDAFEAIKPERAGFLIRLRSTNAPHARMSLLIMDAFILLALGAFTLLWTASGLEKPLAEIPTLFISLILVIIIKTLTSAIGERYAERLTSSTYYYLKILSFVFYPFTFILVKLGTYLNPPMTESEQREEFDALVDTAREEGTLDDGEYRIFKSIMNFSEIRVADIMTPRSVVFSVQSTMTVEQVALLPELQMYSRFPVWEGDSTDGIIGYALTKDVLRAALDGRRNRTMDRLARQANFIPDNATLEKALEQFLQGRMHMFIVVDEYGGIEGLVTMEDVLETMLGTEIVDEADRIVDLRDLAKSRRDKRVAEYQERDMLNKQDLADEDMNSDE
ncbi:MAG: CBS domain-containing protein, partial [Candidatus Kapaibacteriota bacterium]